MSVIQYHYRVTINGDTGNVLNELPKSWNEMAWLIEERGGYAKLERRAVATGDDLSDFHAWDGWMHAGGVAFSGWEVFAELDFRSPITGGHNG